MTYISMCEGYPELKTEKSLLDQNLVKNIIHKAEGTTLLQYFLN